MNSNPRCRAISMKPELWGEARLRFLCKFNPSKSEVAKVPGNTEVSFVPMERLSTEGVFDLSETKSIDTVYNGFTYFRDGDVVVAKITPCFENGKGGLAKGLKNSTGFGTTEFHVIRPTKLDGRYLEYLCRSHPFRTIGAFEMFGAGGQKRVPETYLKDEFWPIPPRTHQPIIANFLDRETAMIDALIEKEVRLLALMEEKRTALISHAVTKGLDPKAELKESGVEWIGKIPSDWEVMKFKRVVKIAEGQVDPRHTDFSDLQFIGPEHIEKNTGTIVETVLVSDVQAISGKYFAPAGCVIYSKIRPELRKVCMVVVDSLCSADMYPLLCSDRIAPKFLFYWLLSEAFSRKMIDESMRVAMPKINREVLSNTVIPIPKLQTQIRLLGKLEIHLARIDALKTKINRAIALLREKRTALISAAVTGKIQVKGDCQ